MIVVNMYKLRVANMKCEKERERERVREHKSESERGYSDYHMLFFSVDRAVDGWPDFLWNETFSDMNCSEQPRIDSA